MFDFAFSEIALIAAVALIAIGPKDMPVAIRAVSGWVKKARRMASEFQTHVDDMMKDTELSEVRKSISELRSFNIRGEIEKAIDPDGGLRSTFASNPLTPSVSKPVTSVEEIAVSEPVPDENGTPHDAANPLGAEAGRDAALGGDTEAQADTRPRAPAFVPPHLVPPPEPRAAAGAAVAPAFIPPSYARAHDAPPPRR